MIDPDADCGLIFHLPIARIRTPVGDNRQDLKHITIGMMCRRDGMRFGAFGAPGRAVNRFRAMAAKTEVKTKLDIDRLVNDIRANHEARPNTEATPEIGPDAT